MADEQNNARAETPESRVRIDLTSLDIRTGTLKLPARLQEVLQPGPIKARELDREVTHALHFEAPRDLHGLADFFESHAMKPNDAVVIDLSADVLLLEPYFRQRRRIERSDRVYFWPDLQADLPGKKVVKTEPAPEPGPEATPGRPAAEANAASDASEAPDREQVGPPPGERGPERPHSLSEFGVPPDDDDSGLARLIDDQLFFAAQAAGKAQEVGSADHPDTDIDDSPALPRDNAAPETPTETDVTSMGTGPISDVLLGNNRPHVSHDEIEEATDPFAGFGNYDADELDDVDDLLQLGTAAESGEESLLESRHVDDAAWRRSASLLDSSGGRNAGFEWHDEEPTPADAAPGEAQGQFEQRFHVVPRRPFRVHTVSDVRKTPSEPPAGQVRGAERAADAEELAAEAATRADRAESPAPAAAQPSLWDDVDRSAASLVAGYLSRPDLPTIIRASQLALELNIPVAEIDVELRQQADRPDSRINQIRPDYYMLKRTTDRL